MFDRVQTNAIATELQLLSPISQRADMHYSYPFVLLSPSAMPSPQHQLQQEWKKPFHFFQVYAAIDLFLFKMYSFLAPLTKCKLNSKVDGSMSRTSSCSLYLQTRST